MNLSEYINKSFKEVDELESFVKDNPAAVTLFIVQYQNLLVEIENWMETKDILPEELINHIFHLHDIFKELKEEI